MASDTTVLEAVASIAFFGHEPTEARVRIRPRDRAWRVGGAARTAAVFLVVAPLAAIVPPHAPWALGALGVGTLLARRRLRERFTLETLSGNCPRCGSPISGGRTRLREPHPVTCDGCHHQGHLQLPAGLLEGAGPDAA